MMLAFAATTFDPTDPTSVIPMVMPVIVAQWTLQLLFTIGAHLREVTTLPAGRIGRSLPICTAIACGALLGMPGIAGEETYLMLLGLYAIPFPMYAIAAAVRGFDHPLPHRWVLAILLVSLAASPLGWLGFIENRTWFLLPAAALTAVAGWVIGRLSRSLRPHAELIHPIRSAAPRFGRLRLEHGREPTRTTSRPRLRLLVGRSPSPPRRFRWNAGDGADPPCRRNRRRRRPTGRIHIDGR